MKIRSTFRALTFAASLGLALLARPTAAEEGGSGHYMPGSMASFIDGVSPTPALLVRYNLLRYTGSFDGNLPIAGSTAVGVDAAIWGHGLTLFLRPDVEMDERWSFAMSLTVPLLVMDVSAQTVLPGALGGVPAGKSDQLTAVGDLVFQPAMVNYSVSPNTNVNFRTSFYIPTGSYEVGRLANTGKNYWTFEPMLAWMYFGTKNGREASIFTGISINSENGATSYHSGSQLHADGTFAQHLPLLGGVTGIGATTTWYRQIEPDDGAGANLGAFRGETASVGPVVSFIGKLGEADLLAELKWLHEYHTRNRLAGDTVVFKFACKF